MPITPDVDLHVRVVENIDRAVVVIDRHGSIVLFNPAAQAATGRSERQALGKPFEQVFAGQDGLNYLVQSSLRDGRSISDHENMLLPRPIGEPLPVSVSVSPLLDARGGIDGVVLIIRDLSRIHELEEAVRRADRLSMLGAMAAGLAHEIKNPLGGIRGAAQLLAMELPDPETMREYTTVMIREVERINSIIEELMDLTRPRELRQQPVDLAKLLSDIVLLQQEAARDKGIGFHLQLDPTIPPLLGDEALLHRLFLNLIKNAAEAVEPGGKVEISSKIASEMHLMRPGERPTAMVRVEVRDNGRGIPSEQLDNIFTPFFTTKEQGSGLGLATCQTIVNQHHGLIKVDSVPGTGSIFSVSLPLWR